MRVLPRKVGVAPCASFCLNWIGPQAVDDWQGLYQPSFVTIGIGAVADHQLPIDVEGLRVAVSQDVVARETRCIVGSDDSLAFRHLTRVKHHVVRREVSQVLNSAGERANQAEDGALMIGEY